MTKNGKKQGSLRSLTRKEKELHSSLTSRGQTAKELSEELECSVKRVKNMIGRLRANDITIIKTLDEELVEIYMLPQDNVPKIKLAKKKFDFTISKNHPYMVINLPKPKKGSVPRLQGDM